MSASDPEGAAGARGAGPVARISHGALRANAAAWADAVADLRLDAWGHGAREVADTLLTAGMARVIVDDAVREALGDRWGAERVVGDVPAQGAASVDLRALYGLPGAGGRPVMRMSGTVLSVKELRAGEGVSYGYTHRAARDTRIALVTGGYAQGVVRALGNRVTVRAAGDRHPIVGRVAMDVCVVEIGDADVARGDEVVFFGDPAAGDPALGDWCAATGMDAPEIVAMAGLRAIREHVR